MIAIVFFLLLIFSLFCQSLQQSLRARFERTRSLIFCVATALSFIFCISAWRYSALSTPIALLIAGYTFFPTLIIYSQQTRLDRVPSRAATLPDLAAILLLWLPLELSVGAAYIPKAVQGTLHTIAYGIAVTLALFLFLLFRNFPGMKYRLPQTPADLLRSLIGLVVAAVVLIPLGLRLGFLAPAHAPQSSLLNSLLRIATIFCGTALPEEILFRSLIQNWITQRLPSAHGAWGIVLGALVFGSAHLNNGPFAFPNWRYMILATLAGLLFGTVFARSTSVLASMLLHTAVDATKYLWF
jgi:membrane protease YdiL (CAAX protease family)